MIDTVMIPISQLRTNEGQIEGVIANPRIILNEEFSNLCQSIDDNPEMLELRELLVYKSGDDYIVIGGNMRLQAMRTLQYRECPCKIIPQDTSPEELTDIMMKDNIHYGEEDAELMKDWIDVADEIAEKEEQEEAKKSISFMLSPEQFKFVKQKLNRINKDDNAEALMQCINQYRQRYGQA